MTGLQLLVLVLSLGAVFLFLFLVRRAANKQLEQRGGKQRAKPSRT